jgi:sn-glycerol 3-phosphate transport system substrate-binding protein
MRVRTNRAIEEDRRMKDFLSRRTLVKGAAAGAALATSAATLGIKPSSVFAAPTLVQSTGSTVEVKYWTAYPSGVNGDAQKKLVADFHAAQTDVKINMQTQATYEDLAAALTAALQTGDEPHLVVLSDVWWFRFYLAQALSDLNPLLKAANIDTSDYVQSLYTEYTRHGGQYAVPFGRSTPLMYYNQDSLDAAGVDASEIGTWDGIAKVAPKLTGGKTKYAFGFGNASSYGAWVLQGAVWAFGGHYSTPDFNITIADAPAVACGEFMRKMVEDKVAISTEDPTTDFQTGLTSIFLASTGGLTGIQAAAQFKVKTAFLPTEKQFGCCTGGAGLSIINTAPDDVQAAAMKFIDFSTNTANTTAWSQATGYMPVRTSAVNSDSMKAYLKEHPNSQVAIDQLPKTSPQDSARVFIPTGDQIIGQGWEQILVKNTPAQDAFNAVKDQLDQEKVDVLDQIKAIEG